MSTQSTPRRTAYTVTKMSWPRSMYLEKDLTIAIVRMSTRHSGVSKAVIITSSEDCQFYPKYLRVSKRSCKVFVGLILQRQLQCFTIDLAGLTWAKCLTKIFVMRCISRFEPIFLGLCSTRILFSLSIRGLMTRFSFANVLTNTSAASRQIFQKHKLMLINTFTNWDQSMHRLGFGSFISHVSCASHVFPLYSAQSVYSADSRSYLQVWKRLPDADFILDAQIQHCDQKVDCDYSPAKECR